MSAKVCSIADVGADGILIDIECHISNGLPAIVIVGFANKAVDEAKERIRSAFANSNISLPKKRITINLAPADLPKDSTSFDLAIAASILLASGQVKPDANDNILLGELALDGGVRPIRGVIGKILSAKSLGYDKYFVPRANLEQAMLVPGVSLYPVDNLRDLYLHLSSESQIKPVKSGISKLPLSELTIFDEDFSHIVGQARAKRALEIAAAGGHNVLLNGPPGTGKSMLAKAFVSILPPLERDEVLEITHIHSLSSRRYDNIVSKRPFRAPHHSASDVSIIGGGQYPKPGEISLSHAGVLFLDELPEYSRASIEALRQPLEDKKITVSRAQGSIDFPANFILIATSNPCPCGYFGTDKPCNCLPSQIVKYQRKISGPISDRIDMHVEVDEVLHKKLLADSSSEQSKNVLERVKKARSAQAKRFGKSAKINASMTNQEVKRISKVSSPAKEMLDQAAEKLQISARSYMRTLKVARTIADLEEQEEITPEHISEALQYRRREIAL